MSTTVIQRVALLTKVQWHVMKLINIQDRGPDKSVSVHTMRRAGAELKTLLALVKSGHLEEVAARPIGTLSKSDCRRFQYTALGRKTMREAEALDAGGL